MSMPTIANNAYQTAAKLAQQVSGETTSARNSVDFGEMVQSAVESVVEKGKVSDQKAVALVEGKADVVDVVTVRNRVISAYEEIMRMPI